MKLKYGLGFSILLNIALGAFFLLNTRTPPASLPTGAATPTVMLTPDSNLEPMPRTEPPAKPVSRPTVDWVQALRTAGISEKLIATVAAADFESRWQTRSRDNQKKFDRGEIDETTLTRFDLEHDAEQEKELRAVLGDEEFRRWDQAKVLADVERTGVDLTANESDDLYDLRKELDRKRLELDKARQQGKVSVEDAESQRAAMYAQYNEQLLKLVGEDRYAQVQGGGDVGSGDLHRSLHTMNADETQVAGMEITQQTWNSQRRKLEIQMETGKLTAEEFEKQMKALDGQRDQGYQQALGAAAFAEFQKNQDPRYQSMKRNGSDWGFSDADVNNLYAAIKTYENSLRSYRDSAQAIEAQGQSVDWLAVENVLTEYSHQTENALRASLGDKFDKLKRSNVLPFER